MKSYEEVKNEITPLSPRLPTSNPSLSSNPSGLSSTSNPSGSSSSTSVPSSSSQLPSVKPVSMGFLESMDSDRDIDDFDDFESVVYRLLFQQAMMRPIAQHSRAYADPNLVFFNFIEPGKLKSPLPALSPSPESTFHPRDFHQHASDGNGLLISLCGIDPSGCHDFGTSLKDQFNGTLDHIKKLDAVIAQGALDLRHHLWAHSPKQLINIFL